MKTSFKKLTCLFLAILMIMSVAITGVSAATVDENPTAEAKTVYVDTSNISADLAYFAWKWTGSSSGSWYTLTHNGTYYEVEVNIGESIIFAAFPAGTEMPSNDWSGKVGQTDNINDYDGSANLCTLTAGGNQGLAYEWSVYDAESGTTGTVPPTTKETLAPTVVPSKATDPANNVPTYPTEADENENLYVVAQSNLNLQGVKTKTIGDLISVSYALTAAQVIDGAQATVTFDTDKLGLLTANNTVDSMFPVAKGVSYNLTGGELMFNFSTINNDFTNGGIFVNLVFERKYDAVGTASVFLNVTDLTSKATTYVEDGVIATTEGITVAPAVAAATATTPSVADPVATGATTDLAFRVSSNIVDADAVEFNADKATVKVTFGLNAGEPIAFGNATVTYDESLLALEDYYNTMETMFPVLSNVSYNLNAAPGTMKFAFTGVDAVNKKGLFDFSNGATFVTLVFTVRAGAQGRADINLAVEDLGSFTKEYVSAYRLKYS